MTDLRVTLESLRRRLQEQLAEVAPLRAVAERRPELDGLLADLATLVPIALAARAGIEPDTALAGDIQDLLGAV